MSAYKLPGKPVFIDEEIKVFFNHPPLHAKLPPCPDAFEWMGEEFMVESLLSEWKDFERKGRLARNMSDAHLGRALVIGSRGSGRFFFRVRTSSRRIFDLYYDRSVKDAVDQSGRWVLYREFKIGD
jgi:hypothetical protein